MQASETKRLKNTWSTRPTSWCGARTTSLWVHRNLFWQLSIDGNSNRAGMSRATTATPKSSSKTAERVSDAAVGKGKTGQSEVLATAEEMLDQHHHLSLNREGRWGTTDDFTTSFLHFALFSSALWDLANSRPVHSLMLSSHLFLCLPCLLPPFTVNCKMVLARPDEREI